MLFKISCIQKFHNKSLLGYKIMTLRKQVWPYSWSADIKDNVGNYSG